MEGKEKALSDWRRYRGKGLGRLCASEMRDDLSRRQLEFHPIFPSLNLHDPFGEALISNDDLEGGSHQIRIVELHARSFVSIIPEHF
jgi:hypothetical protein